MTIKKTIESEEFKNAIKAAIEIGKRVGDGYDEETKEEVTEEWMDEESATDAVIEVCKKYLVK